MTDTEQTPDITLKKINDRVVVPLKSKHKGDPRPPRGADMFPTAYPNITIIARKKSGKTSCIQTIIKGCVGKNTKIIVFASTYNKDPAWLCIREWCKKNEINIEGYLSLKEGKVDVLKTFVDSLEDINEEEKLEEEDDIEPDFQPKKGRGRKEVQVKLKTNLFDGDKEDEEEEEDEDEPLEEDLEPMSKKTMELFKQQVAIKQKMFGLKYQPSIQKKDPYLTPEYMIIFDDLSNELKSPSLISFYKKNRHFKCMTITSTQYIHDLKPEALKQSDYLLLFRGLDQEKLEKVRRDADLSLSLDKLQLVYENATREPFCFLYVDRLTETYRKCFDKQYIISA